MLFENEKRVVIKLKAKPSIIELANQIYRQDCNPYSDEPRLDELFEMLVTEYARHLGMRLVSENQETTPVDLPVVNNYLPDVEPIIEESSNEGIDVTVNNILR